MRSIYNNRGIREDAPIVVDNVAKAPHFVSLPD